MSKAVMEFIYENAVFPIMRIREIDDTTENRLAILSGMLERELPDPVLSPMSIEITVTIVSELERLRNSLLFQ